MVPNWSNVKALRVMFLSFLSCIMVSSLIWTLLTFYGDLLYFFAPLLRWCFKRFICAVCKSSGLSIILDVLSVVVQSIASIGSM